ncbi:MAG: elongation factor Ts [Campylobacteraceae bacterium]|jgi:elongation factor Ts|nr:elongation factor Ts [Campylobacteraceae bacterium]MBT3882702.1 elongation factor Ts [Campylobacteraceae bacterium]MBT4030428.1 elongation factor Ts [Campylobacteraceae bacterium]MBT4178993.1 elongation factor Ts [Campylobacteraceae bacterium]MBT4573008.1 elongation factor Ts [Campylobacteraceae bacterium]
MAGATPKLIKELRGLSGAGLSDCKKALNECEGDIEKSMAFLRESGLAKAAKKAGNVAAEGLVSILINEDFTKATLAEINSQTDFVAKNDDFINLKNEITAHVQVTGSTTTEELNSTTINGTNFEEYLNGRIAIIGENIVARRMATVSTDTGVVNGYVHTNGKVGVILSATCAPEAKEKAAALLKSLGMHAAAMKPSVISYEDLDPEFVESENKAIIADIEKENIELHRLGKPEKNIPLFVSKSQLTEEALDAAKADMRTELLAQGKPEKIIDNILKGKIERFIEDNTQLDATHALLTQKFVMDDSKTVAQAIADVDASIKLVDYIKFELGEGIEKVEEDFAAEVAAQMGK